MADKRSHHLYLSTIVVTVIFFIDLRVDVPGQEGEERQDVGLN